MKVTENIKAVIFDLDGLLINSEPVWVKTEKKFILDNAKVENPKINHDDYMGMGLKEAVAIMKDKYSMEGDVNDLSRQYRQRFYNQAFGPEGLELLPGVESLLRKFKDYKIALATGGHDKRRAREILERFGLLSYFELIVSSDDVKKGKPAPDVYLATAKKLGVDPAECLVFEDAPNGVLAGKAAKMTVYGVNSDFEILEKLKEAGADEVFSNLSEMDL